MGAPREVMNEAVAMVWGNVSEVDAVGDTFVSDIQLQKERSKRGEVQ